MTDALSNPPVPAGWTLMKQGDVTAAMSAFAVALLHDANLEMFDQIVRMFGASAVLARIEWHPPDFQNGVVHRGITLYESMPASWYEEP
jgi:hypothetical protein